MIPAEVMLLPNKDGAGDSSSGSITPPISTRRSFRNNKKLYTAPQLSDCHSWSHPQQQWIDNRYLDNYRDVVTCKECNLVSAVTSGAVSPVSHGSARINTHPTDCCHLSAHSTASIISTQCSTHWFCWLLIHYSSYTMLLIVCINTGGRVSRVT